MLRNKFVIVARVQLTILLLKAKVSEKSQVCLSLDLDIPQMSLYHIVHKDPEFHRKIIWGDEGNSTTVVTSRSSIIPFGSGKDQDLLLSGHTSSKSDFLGFVVHRGHWNTFFQK